MFRESCTCPRCQSSIDDSQIQKKPAKPERAGEVNSLQEITFKCQDCGLMVDLVCTLGTVRQVITSEVVTEIKRHQEFDARFGAVKQKRIRQVA